MKIRSGFVSNSSSSSFVVCFDKEIKATEDLLSYCKEEVDDISRETFINGIFPFKKLEDSHDILSALRNGRGYDHYKESLENVVSAKYGLLSLQKYSSASYNNAKKDIVECFDLLVNTEEDKFWYVFELDDNCGNNLEYSCVDFFVDEKVVVRKISHH